MSWNWAWLFLKPVVFTLARLCATVSTFICWAFMPEAAVGLYAWTVVVDHAERRAALTSLASLPEGEAAAATT